jgi:AraC family transcriptional regulator
MPPKLISLPVLKLAGFVCPTTSRFGENFTAIPKFWHKYINDGMMDRLQNESFVKNRTQYGVCFPEDPQTGNFEYMIGLELKKGALIPEPYEVRALPPASYAVFSSFPANEANFFAEVYNTWAYIFGTWLPSSGMAINGEGLQFELYDERAMVEKGKICDVYVPVIYHDKAAFFREEEYFTPELSAGRIFQSSPNTMAVNV